MSDQTELTPQQALDRLMKQQPFAALASVRELLDDSQQAALDDIVKTVIARQASDAQAKLASLAEQREARWRQLREVQFAHELQWHKERAAEIEREIGELKIVIRAAGADEAAGKEAPKKRRAKKSS